MKERVSKRKVKNYLKNYLSTGRDRQADNERGSQNQQRALKIAESMVQDGLFFRVRSASNKQNREGVDFWVCPMGGDIRIPFQVKRSVQSMQDLRKDDEHLRSKLAIVIVNQYRDDLRIRDEIMRAADWWLSNNRPRPQ